MWFIQEGSAVYSYVKRTFPLRCGVATVVIKNWEPFVLGPALAIDSNPGLTCFLMKFSSANLLPGEQNGEKKCSAGDKKETTAYRRCFPRHDHRRQ